MKLLKIPRKNRYPRVRGGSLSAQSAQFWTKTGIFKIDFQRKILRKFCLRKIWNYRIFYQALSGKISAVSLVFPKITTCPDGHFQPRNFRNFFFRTSSKLFGWCCQNCILRVQRNILGYIFFKSVHVHSELANEQRKKSTYWGNDCPFVICNTTENKKLILL